MIYHGRRLILHVPFERALWTVLDALVREGFTIQPTDSRAVRGKRRHPRRCILLHAMHPEAALLPCEIALSELSSCETVVMASDTLEKAVEVVRADDHTLAMLAQAVDERLRRALAVVSNRGRRCASAA